MIKAPGITVNGINIAIEQINEEVQYHPAPNLLEAKQQAMRALVIKELLLQEAVRCGLSDRSGALTKSEEVIDDLLKQEISLPETCEDDCRRYYTNNEKRFFTAPLFEVSHIFFPAPPGDAEEREKAHRRALEVLKVVREQGGRFEELAREHSACSSAERGGRLGQVTKGQTVPSFELALQRMQADSLSEEPVETEVGFHIIKVHEREDGKLLPFEAVKDWIADFLRQKSWRCAVSQYIQILAGRAEISGFQLRGAETPLVQ